MQLQGEPAIGIDIGTSYCRVAVLNERGMPELVTDEYGDRHIPAVVRYSMQGDEVGYYPARFLVTDWENTVREVTRYIGRWQDILPDVLDSSPCTVYQEGGRACFDVLYRTVSAERVYATLVGHLIKLAAALCRRPVRAVVLTVPASAEDRFRVIVKEAVERLGVRVLSIINQPTAALLAFQHSISSVNKTAMSRLVAVVDIGGGTSDVSIARIEHGEVTIVSTAGKPHLGGTELQRRLAEGINRRLCQAHGLDLLGGDSGSKVSSLGLWYEAGVAMEALSDRDRTALVLDHCSGFGRDLWLELDRHEFESWIGDELRMIGSLCGTALRRASLVADQIDSVIVTGGASQIPAVRRAIALAFNRSLDRLALMDPEGAVALGAAVQAGMLLGQLDGHVRDVTPFPLGIAAYPAHGMPNDKSKMFSVIVDRDTAIPTPSMGSRGAFQQIYHTRYPYQTEMAIEVLQYRGERACTASDYQMQIPAGDCEVLAVWTLSGIQRRYLSVVEVTFEIDGDGILHVIAREQGTQNMLQQQIERW